MPFLDFTAIKESVGIDDAAVALNLQPKLSGQQLRAPCPTCKSGGDRALVITPSKGLFYCFAAGRGGDVIALTAHILGCEIKDAADWLAERYLKVPTLQNSTSLQKSGQKPDRAPERQKAETTASSFNADDYASKLTYDASMAELGISEETARRLKIGVAPKGLYRGMVCFPVRNEDGSITDFVAYSPETGQLKVPKHWGESKVVRLKTA